MSEDASDFELLEGIQTDKERQSHLDVGRAVDVLSRLCKYGSVHVGGVVITPHSKNNKEAQSKTRKEEGLTLSPSCLMSTNVG